MAKSLESHSNSKSLLNLLNASIAGGVVSFFFILGGFYLSSPSEKVSSPEPKSIEPTPEVKRVIPAAESAAPSMPIKEFKFRSRVITDGFTTGKKIHLVGGNNPGKPYVGFILNINTKLEDELVLSGNFSSALELYRKLELQGDTTAAHNLGLMYTRGLGAPKDIRRGMSYLEKSMDDLANYNTSKNYYDKAMKELSSSGV